MNDAILNWYVESSKLIKLYNEEFLPKLIGQATDEKSRYKPVTHKSLNVGDIVLIKEDFTKPANMPMGRIVEIYRNDLGEVTSARVLKGASREVLKRHASVLIPLLQDTQMGQPYVPESDIASEQVMVRPKRAAAIQSENATRQMLQ